MVDFYPEQQCTICKGAGAVEQDTAMMGKDGKMITTQVMETCGACKGFGTLPTLHQ